VTEHLARGWDFGSIGTPQFLLRQLPVAVGAIFALEVGQLLWQSKLSVPSLVGRLPLPARWAVYAAFVILVLMFGIYRNNQFIYFQF
jgi:hypothetical protein